MKTLFDIVLKGCYNKFPDKTTPGEPGKGGVMVAKKEKRGRPCAVQVGQRYGRLVVVRRVSDIGRGKVRFLCRCDCDNEVIVLAECLRNGTTKSCGCLRRDLMRQRAEALAKSLKDN